MPTDIHEVDLDGQTINIYKMETRYKCALRHLAKNFGVRVVQVAPDGVVEPLDEQGANADK